MIDLTNGETRFVRAGRTAETSTDRAQLIDAIAIAGKEIYFTARPSGTLYRYDFRTNRMTSLGAPVARSETRGLFMERGLLGGASAAGQNRPTVIRYAPNRRALLIGTAADAAGGGALLRYDLAGARLSSRLNPFATAGNVGQAVTSLAHANDTATRRVERIHRGRRSRERRVGLPLHRERA